jgi:DNA-binding transcriptional MerR regulator
MAKIIQQLDLFGMAMENPSPAKKAKQPAKNTNTASKEPINELPESKAEIIDTTPKSVSNSEIKPITLSDPTSIVYSNEQIVVKVKTAPLSKETQKSETKRGRKSFKEINATVDLIEIPDEATLQQKLYYSISEVAGWFKVNTSLLRYWENEFDILQPRKTRKGDRLFRVEDIKNLELIYFLLRQRKFSIEGAKSYLKNNKGKIDTETQLVKTLTDFKGFLLELKSSLNSRS